MNFPVYKGKLNDRKMSKNEKQAFKAYYNMNARTKKYNLPKSNIEIREFMGWWLENLKIFKGKKPTCGRIDHNKGYSWNNIFMQDMIENVKESNHRNQQSKIATIMTGKKVIVSCIKSGEDIAIIDSIKETSRIFGVSFTHIWNIINNKYKKQTSKINFNLRSAN